MSDAASFFILGAVAIVLGSFSILANRFYGDLNSKVAGHDLARMADWGRKRNGRYPGIIVQGGIVAIVGVVLVAIGVALVLF